MSLLLRLTDFFLDPLNVAASEALHFAAELKVAANLFVAQNAEAIDYR